MKVLEENTLMNGPVGSIEAIINHPANTRGIALVAHPHPLFGGSNTNKVAQTLARGFCELGYVAIRPNFRSVGGSAGAHDLGVGETDDMLAVLAEAKQRYGDLPVALSGFSFGAYVQTRVAEALVKVGRPAQALLLVGLATGQVEGERQYTASEVPSDTILIHGSADTTVPLVNVLQWAEPQEIPVIVVPGAEHFFHRRLHILRDILLRTWRH